MWARYTDIKPDSRHELEVLLERLWGGGEEDLEICRAAGLGKAIPSLECEDACAFIQWQAYHDEVIATEAPVAKIGAISIAFGIYMDVEAPKVVVHRLNELCQRLLRDDQDEMVIAALLKMMKFYDFASKEVLGRINPLLDHKNAVIREFAYERFRQYTACKEKYDPIASLSIRQRQVERIREKCLHK